MAWKKEYAKNRREKARADDEYRMRRNEQSTSDPEGRKKYMRDYYERNPEKFRADTQEKKDKKNAARRERYANDEGIRLALQKAAKSWSEKNPIKLKARRIRQYGLSIEQFDSMMVACGNKCEICGHDQMGRPKFFPMIDHCHSTGRVRGILCSNCNQAIGKMGDSVDRLKSAIKYLQRGNKK